MPKTHQRLQPRRPLPAFIAAYFGLSVLAPLCFAGTDVVTNCNDSGPGSLRDTIAHAAEQDVVDLNQANMQCSESIISLASEIVIPQNDLFIKYDGNQIQQFAIRGNNARVFHHTGTGTLKIQRLEIKYGSVAANDASARVYGGCIDSAGTVDLEYSTVRNCTISGTASFVEGGGIFAGNGLVLDHAVVEDNSLSNSGGSAYGAGIGALHHWLVTDSTISGNTIVANGQLRDHGTALALSYAQQDSKIDRCTITGNTGPAEAIYVYSGLATTTPVISDSTISGNATPIASASALSVRGPMLLANSTIAFNQGGVEKLDNPFGAHYAYSPAVFFRAGAAGGYAGLQSTIVANNVASGSYYGHVRSQMFEVSGSFTISGGNDLVDGTSDVTLPPDTIAADPQLLPLADNGGPTLTHAFRFGSPAFGNGNNFLDLATDQRGSGYPRAAPDGAVDIGSYQEQIRDRIFVSGFD